MLSAYLVLVHGYTAEQALLPFARIQGIPVKNYTDATWYDTPHPDHRMSVSRALSCFAMLTLAAGFVPRYNHLGTLLGNRGPTVPEGLWAQRQARIC
jgi:hypothetical protein